MALPDLASLRGLARSLVVYRLDRAHARGLRALYRPFIAPGDLVIDVGAHVGDRVAACRALGARVVAVEPQRLLARTLSLLYALDRNVTVERLALGPAAGEAVLHVNRANPTVSTRAADFLAATRGAEGWEGQSWDTTETVPADTLDALVARHGSPAFIKIDVEGFEPEVLAGLTAPPPALSFEIVTAHPAAGTAALDRSRALGYTAFRLSLGEAHLWSTPWLDGPSMAGHLSTLPASANSGDVYAVQPGHQALAGTDH